MTKANTLGTTKPMTATSRELVPPRSSPPTWFKEFEEEAPHTTVNASLPSIFGGKNVRYKRDIHLICSRPIIFLLLRSSVRHTYERLQQTTRLYLHLSLKRTIELLLFTCKSLYHIDTSAKDVSELDYFDRNFLSLPVRLYWRFYHNTVAADDHRLLQYCDRISNTISFFCHVLPRLNWR
jgi:hypothetical protein